ncbi:LysR family transcriptional regulator [Xylophilus sp. Leaf220]|uniref:LysR family transcriptional regulator n=1 Tax=Xylophilus sp. Leaf220 TaxID=1735686 RepID=UPI0009E93D45|nr:LysR family transcriptional regulator [Xylophilus sp. Leaf220]
MPTPRDVLTPDMLAMLQQIAAAGSFAAAARALGMVPSALTYRVRQVEDALDVLLFDRRSRQARLTEAGAELVREGTRLLGEIDAMAHRVQRVATGWEPQLTIASDGLIDRATLMELVEAFYALEPPTRLKLRDEILSGTLQSLTSGQADLALGVGGDPASAAGVQVQPLGTMHFIHVVAPHHPLAHLPGPLLPEVLMRHRVIAVADSARAGRTLTVGVLDGQDVLTVPSMQAKLEALLRGLGVGSLPEPMVRPEVARGRLVVLKIQQPPRMYRVGYAWCGPAERHGRALQWWLEQLARPGTRQALLEGRGPASPAAPLPAAIATVPAARSPAAAAPGLA